MTNRISITNSLKDSYIIEVNSDCAAEVNGGLGGLTDDSIFYQVSSQHQINQYGFTHLAGYGRVIPTQYPDFGYSTYYNTYVPLIR